ncbi:hypothetical protein [Planococcus sp. ISL-109]|uniref:hypothetical protein n=1 Tax=Planococcus sp. ISL-109 TaxID=2819166 RepID=UPI001BE85252|nr:hypothetical protein [Planococcus sp. ISL-109]MBT2584209.1 hypothetical protein [Planococcus sp. ISL-109]
MLRRILLDSTINEESLLFSQALDKIKTKTYLTDRSLSGSYKTNREKRWECHPQSVQFALRSECWKIEKALLLQICRFNNAPKALVEKLIENKLLNMDFTKFTCPILGDTIDFNDFKDAIINPDHGKSRYQVGHMNPLKSVSEGTFGHTAENISWITEDGNRIQGSLSLAEVDELLQRIFRNRPYS